MQPGAQLYTVRAFTQTETDFEETIRKIVAIGYKYIQISGAGPIPVQRFADICNSYGIKPVITHTDPVRIKNETEAVIEDHRLLGAKYIGIGSMPGEYREGAEGVMQFIEDYRPAAEKIKSAGMLFMYHNHDFEFEKLNGIHRMEYLIEGFLPDS